MHHDLDAIVLEYFFDRAAVAEVCIKEGDIIGDSGTVSVY